MATLLPNGKQQFIDANGNPLVGGSVYFYIPGTTTPKDTYQDSGASILNTNPVVLDSRGQATIYGTGIYRQIVKDAAGNTIWDQVTAQNAVASDVQSGVLLTATSVAGTNTITGTLAPAPSSYTDGMLVRFKSAGVNTGAVTVNWSGVGAVALTKPGTSGPTALIGGEIQAAQIVECAYDAANNRFVMTTPSAGLGTVSSVSDATNGGLTVTNPTTTPALALNLNDLTSKTSPTTSDSVAIIDAAASNATKKATLASVRAAFSGSVAQVVATETGAVATGTTAIPNDDTIPQNTEGDQYMSLSITPTNASSTLVIEVTWIGTNSAGAVSLTVALFQDTTANAIAAAQQLLPTAGAVVTVPFRHKMTAGTTSATTFKVRAGAGSAGTTTFNGASGARLMGGVLASSIVITEILP